jgi:hypothetical protein
VTDPVSGNGHRPELPRPGTGRRRSMLILGLLVVGLPLAFAIRMLTEGPWRQVVSTEVLKARDVIYLPELKLFLVHGDPPLALRAVSPHVGEPIAFCPTSQTFQEMLHGSKWDPSGYWMDGPAPRGMDRVQVRVDNGFVEINITSVTLGPPRGAGPPAHPTGPFCGFERPEDAQRGFLPEPSPPPV